MIETYPIAGGYHAHDTERKITVRGDSEEEALVNLGVAVNIWDRLNILAICTFGENSASAKAARRDNDVK